MEVQETPSSDAVRKMCTVVSGRNINNKLGRSTIYTGEGSLLWSPPSAVHIIDASAREIPQL